MLHTLLVVKLGLIRGWLLLGENSIPVDAGEPGVSHDLFCVRLSRAKSLRWVLVKKLSTDISSLFAQKWEVKSGLVIFDVSEQLLLVLIVKRWLAAQHFVNYASE